MRDHLLAAVSAGAHPSELDGPPLPSALAYLYQWFGELASARGNSGFGFNPLSFVEIEAWARLNDITPTPFEVQVLRRIDVAFLLVTNSKPHG